LTSIGGVYHWGGQTFAGKNHGENHGNDVCLDVPDGYSKLEIDEIPVEQMGKFWKSVKICENCDAWTCMMIYLFESGGHPPASGHMAIWIDVEIHISENIFPGSSEKRFTSKTSTS